MTVSQSSGVLPILSAWRVLREGQPGSTAIFVHLLDEHDQIVAQDDRLGVPRHTWQPGDEFVQVQRLPIEQRAAWQISAGAGPLRSR